MFSADYCTTVKKYPGQVLGMEDIAYFCKKEKLLIL